MALGWKSNGFTPAKKAACLEGLGRGWTVAEACREAKVSPTTFYKHEKKDPEFASLCRAARARSGGAVSLDILAWERGVTGVDEQVVHGGRIVATRRRRSDSVFKMLLEGADPERRLQIRALRARIEKELRPKIEAELRAEIAERERESRRDSATLFDELAARVGEIEAMKAAEAKATAGEADGRGEADGGGEE